LTYSYRAFRVCPRLLVSSPEKRCGKTTLLETIQALCYRGLTASNISAASLFRSLDAWSPTLLVDEADTFLPNNDELRGILNSGHTRSSAYVLRTVGDQHTPKRFPTFAPIAIGMIKRPADTLLDRSIVIQLRRKLTAEPVVPLPLEAESEYLPLRQKCLRWVADQGEDLNADRSLVPTDLENDRAGDNWQPLLAIAAACDRLNDAQAACRQLSVNDDDNQTVALLSDLRQIFVEERKDKLRTTVLIKKLIALEERPWGEFQRGRPLNANGLASLLKDFGVNSVQVRVGPKNHRHYQLADLMPVFERYLPSESVGLPPESAATPLQTQKTLEKPPGNGMAANVAAEPSAQTTTATDTATKGVASSKDTEVADAAPLPLQVEAEKPSQNQCVTECSGVAAEIRVGNDTHTRTEVG
jgi:putative DNA primase/helicase